jgi:hypothetical protein
MVLDDWYRLCILSLKLKFGLSEDSSAVLDGRGWSLRGTTRLSHSDHHPANRHPQSSRHPVLYGRGRNRHDFTSCSTPRDSSPQVLANQRPQSSSDFGMTQYQYETLSSNKLIPTSAPHLVQDSIDVATGLHG